MLLITSLYSINRDIFEYYDSYSVNRSFIQNIDTKGNYLLTPVLTLKKGEYQVFFELSTAERGNGYFVSKNGEIVLQNEFASNSQYELMTYKVLDNSEQIQVGITYDPLGGNFELKKNFSIFKFRYPA